MAARIIIDVEGGCKFRYLDSLHAALVAGLTSTGVPVERVVGQHALPWTFGHAGYAKVGGSVTATSVTVSTSDVIMSEVLRRFVPGDAKWLSMNGDFVSLERSVVREVPSPIAPGQGEIAVAFASPFLMSVNRKDRGKGEYVRSVDGLDLGGAFSRGLSRRLGRPVSIDVQVDRLSARTDGATPTLVRVRKAGRREIVFPALKAVMTLRGSDRDLEDAYHAGLGEKTRLGFGCPLALS